MEKLIKIANFLADEFSQGRIKNPTEELAKIASENEFNAQEIERVANRANRKIAVHLTKEASGGRLDPHFTFPTIKTADVIMALRPKRPMPTEPSSAPVSLEAVFPDKAPESLRSTRDDDPMSLVNDPKSNIPSKEIAISALEILRHKAKIAKAKALRIEAIIEGLIRDFQKNAANEILSGTPIDVLESIPGTEQIVGETREKLASWGHKINSTTEEFELIETHPLIKIARNIEHYSTELDSAKSEFYTIEKDVELLKSRMKKI